MFKRIGLFLITNVLILVMVNLVTQLLGLQPYLTQYGLDYQSLMTFCVLWGFGGAFISLWLSKHMAKWFMGVKVMKADNVDKNVQWLIEEVRRCAKMAKLKVMPQVGIYNSKEVNAFATGPSQRNSLVAFSSGLLQSMDEKATRGVIAHEVAHIANGDMVTMTLVQGVVNSFVLFFSRVAAYAVSRIFGSSDEEGGGAMERIVFFISALLFDILFGILGSMVVAGFSRTREFRADYGAAKYTDVPTMVHSLNSLKQHLQRADLGNSNAKMVRTLKISNKPSLLALLSTHPSLEVRITTLQGRQ